MTTEQQVPDRARDPEEAVSLKGLRKSFGAEPVLRDVDLSVRRGSVFALLGPNGAGKTTIVRILSTLIQPDAGEVHVGGRDALRDPDGVRRVIGVTGQFSAVDELLNGRENLRLMTDLNRLGRSRGRARIAELLDQFELVEAAGRPVSTYSGGMRRRLDLAMTLVGSPQVIFLDEPTTGLDPRSRRTMWECIRELAAGGVTIFLTTQYLEEADQLADRVAVLDRGEIVAEGSPSELKQTVSRGHVRLRLASTEGVRSASALFQQAVCDPAELSVQIPTDGRVSSLRKMLDDLDDSGLEVEEVSWDTPDLDDVFFAVTGRPTTETSRAA